ncbi:MAG: hypothetical protein AAFX87_31840, partial [Bacteroidota bacterium]
MTEITFQNQVYVGFDSTINIDEFRNATQDQKDYYLKYKAGGLNLSCRGQSFNLGPEDIFNVYNGIFLKTFVSVSKGERVRRTFMEKEHFGLIIENFNHSLIIKEYYFKYKPSDEDEITQRLEVPKAGFLTELYNNII